MRYALTAMIVALTATIFSWVFGASFWQGLLVYLIVGVGTLLIAALLASLAGNDGRRPQRKKSIASNSVPARKASERP